MSLFSLSGRAAARRWVSDNLRRILGIFTNRPSIAVMIVCAFRKIASVKRLVAALLALAVLLPAPLWAAPLKIRFAHVVAQDTPKGLAVERFKTLVAQRSAGRMVVEVYPESSLYGDRDEMQALQAGAVEMLAPSLSKFGRVGFPEFEIFDLPYLFDSL